MLLQKLSDARGVSGHEEEVRALLLDAIRDRVDACRIDSMGNLIAVKKGTGASPLRVLVAAHMDEVGFMITAAEDSGALRFAKVGGIDDRVLPARVVLIGAKRVPGVIGVKPVHLLDKGERDRVTDSRAAHHRHRGSGEGRGGEARAAGGGCRLRLRVPRAAGDAGGTAAGAGKGV